MELLFAIGLVTVHTALKGLISGFHLNGFGERNALLNTSPAGLCAPLSLKNCLELSQRCDLAGPYLQCHRQKLVD